MDQYTHTFKFEINGNFIRGEAEFNTDSKASFKMTEWSEPLDDFVLDYFKELSDLLKRIVNDGDEGTQVKKIVIKEKEK